MIRLWFTILILFSCNAIYKVDNNDEQSILNLVCIDNKLHYSIVDGLQCRYLEFYTEEGWSVYCER